MKSLKFVFGSLIMLSLLLANIAFCEDAAVAESAETEPAIDAEPKKSLGVGVTQSVDGELAIGVQGELETDSIEVEYTYQGIDFHDAKVDVSYRYSLGAIAFTVFQENEFQGYTFDNMNRRNDLGVSAIVPVGDLDFEVSVFGRNGNPAGPVERYDEKTGELISTTPGLTPVEGTNANVAIATVFDIRGLEIEAKTLRNFAEDATLQWLLDASTTYKVGPVDWNLSMVYQGQNYLDENTHAFSWLMTWGMKF